MAENLGKWPSKRGPIFKIRQSDGCGRGAVPLAVERWYDLHGFGCHLGNVGLTVIDETSTIDTSSFFRNFDWCVHVEPTGGDT